MEIDIEKFAKNEGEKIASAIFSKYGENHAVKHKSFFFSFWDGFLGGGLLRLKVEKEIYDRSFHEATAFFLKDGDAKFNDKIIEALKFRISIRVKEPKKLEKEKPEKLLANVIKIYAEDFLLEQNF